MNNYHVFFSNLANSLRMDIISLLSVSPRTVSEIVEELDVEQSKISHALRYLRQCSIVVFKQKGKNKIYFLNKKTIVPILKIIDKHANLFCKGGNSFYGNLSG